MQLGWVEVFDDPKIGGQGVRALRDIPFSSGRSKQNQRREVVADLHCAGAEFMRDKNQTREENPVYLIHLDTQRVFDARHHWIGKINHLPMPQCNLKLMGNGKLVQIKPIVAGDALTFDYGMDYWVYQVTGLELSEWLSAGSAVCQKARMDLFTRMQETMLDYSELLRNKWAGSLSSASSAVEREELLMQLEEYLEGQKKSTRCDSCHA